MASNNVVAIQIAHGLSEPIILGRNAAGLKCLECIISSRSSWIASRRGTNVTLVASAKSLRHGRRREVRVDDDTEASVSNGAALVQDPPYPWRAQRRRNVIADRSARS